MEKLSCFHGPKFAQDCRNSTEPPQTLVTPGHTLKYSQPTKNKELPPQFPEHKSQAMKSAGFPKGLREAPEPQIPSVGSVRIYFNSSSTTSPRLKRLFPQCQLQKGLDTTSSFPSLSGEREKFTAVCFGSRAFLVQWELLCSKIPWQGAGCTQEQLTKGTWKHKCPQCKDFPAKIQREPPGKLQARFVERSLPRKHRGCFVTRSFHVTLCHNRTF